MNLRPAWDTLWLLPPLCPVSGAVFDAVPTESVSLLLQR